MAIAIIAIAMPTLVYTHKVNVTKTIEAVELASGESVTLGADEQLYDNPLAVAPTVETEKTTRLHIPFNGMNLLLAIYLLGVSLFLIHTLFHLIAMSFRLHRNNRKEVVNGITILVSDRWEQTFSYFGKIVMTPADFNSPNRDMLLSHELTHVRQHHSLDLLFAEIFIAFHWFNPLVYIFKKSLSEVHEYLADEQVVGSGTDPIAYQQFILHCVTNSNIPRVANTFSAKLIKNRFAMMTSKRKRNSSLRYLLFIPALIGIFFLFSFKVQEQIIYETEAITQSQTTQHSASIQDSVKLHKNLELALENNLRIVYSSFVKKVEEVNESHPLYATEGADFMIISIGVNESHPTLALQTAEKKRIDPIDSKIEKGYRLDRYKLEDELQFKLQADAPHSHYLYAIVVDNEQVLDFDLGLESPSKQLRVALIQKGKPYLSTLTYTSSKASEKEFAMQEGKPHKEKGAITGTKLILFGPFKLSEGRGTIGDKDYYSYTVDIERGSIPFSLETDSARSWMADSNLFRVAESLDTEPWPFTYIQSNIRYPKGYTPKISDFDHIEIQFNLSETAEISNVKVIKGINPQLDAEVVRVVKSIPDLKPERIFGKERAVTVTLGFSLF